MKKPHKEYINFFDVFISKRHYEEKKKLSINLPTNPIK